MCDRSLNGFGFSSYLDLLSIGTADESELATNKVRLLDYETLEQCQSAPNFPIALEHRDISQAHLIQDSPIWLIAAHT